MFTQRVNQGLLFLGDFTKNIPFLNNLKSEAIKLFNLRKEASNGIAGLDISASAIKLVKINCNEKPFMVENISMLPLPPGAIVKGEIKDVGLVSSTVNQVVKKAGLTTNNIAIAIPRSLAFIKNITIDSRLTQDEIESRAWIEANRHFPELVGDIYLDFSIIGPAAEDESQLELMLVACRKEQVKPYIEILHQAGLDEKIVDIDSYALERALSITPATSNFTTSALLNLDANLSTLIVSQNNSLAYAHDQSYDGQRLLTQATTYLKNNGLGDGVDYVGLLEDTGYHDILKESLLSHLRHTMHFFYASKPNVSIQCLLLSGDCSVVPGLASFIQKEINIETEIANPLANLKFSAEINAEEMKHFASVFMLSCGLALSNLRN